MSFAATTRTARRIRLANCKRQTYCLPSYCRSGFDLLDDRRGMRNLLWQSANSDVTFAGQSADRSEWMDRASKALAIRVAWCRAK